MCCALPVSCKMNCINNVYSNYKSQILYFLPWNQVISFLCDQRSNSDYYSLQILPVPQQPFFCSMVSRSLCVFLSHVGHTVVPLISMQC